QYAAFVETLDHYVGRLLDAIEESGGSNNTLVIFTSDNGGHPEYTANGPLRGSKWNLYEGGIRVPMLVRWPGNISANTTTDQVAVGYDLHPTLADAARTARPNSDGTTLLPALTTQEQTSERSLVWHFPYYHPERGYKNAPTSIGINDFVTSRTRPHSALRVGRHKVVKFYENDKIELYDLGSDPSEAHDLSDQNKSLAIRLRQQLETTLSSMNARMPTLTTN
ncbi:MAG: sulfatase-like hydrolase/transferase, partial [Planctomycetota bacterium]